MGTTIDWTAVLQMIGPVGAGIIVMAWLLLKYQKSTLASMKKDFNDERELARKTNEAQVATLAKVWDNNSSSLAQTLGDVAKIHNNIYIMLNTQTEMMRQVTAAAQETAKIQHETLLLVRAHGARDVEEHRDMREDISDLHEAILVPTSVSVAVARPPKKLRSARNGGKSNGDE